MTAIIDEGRDGLSVSNLYSLKKPAFWQGITWAHGLVFLGCWLGGVFDGMDSYLFAVLLPKVIPDLAGTADKVIVSRTGSFILFLFLIG